MSQTRPQTSGKNRKSVSSAFQWQIPFNEYLDAQHKLHVLQEADVMRGILALFFGASCARVYTQNNNQIAVKDDVRIRQTSRQGSEDWLTFYAGYGEKMSSLLQLLYPATHDTDSEDLYDLMSNSLKGYLVTLRQVVHQVVGVLVLEGEPFMTRKKKDGKSLEACGQLFKFRQFMKSRTVAPLLKSIDFLHHSHNQVIRSEDFFYNYRCTRLLIDVFYDHLTIAGSHQDQTIAWNLFLTVLRPTLFYLDDMLDNGCSEDVHEEFMFDVEDLDVNKESDFWNACLRLKDEEAIPLILKPLISHLNRGIRSRLLLKASRADRSNFKRKTSTFDQFYAQFMKQQIILPEEQDKEHDNKDSRSETPDSGEGDELEDRTESPGTDNDVSPHILSSETPAVKSPESLDEGLGSGVSPAVDFGPGQLQDLPSLDFPNITPLDSVYFRTEYPSVLVYNPELQQLPVVGQEMLYDLPDRMRTPIRLAIERSLYPVIISRCDAASQSLMTAFRESYTRHLKFHTDYWLLHRDSHCISLYLDRLFQQITFHDEKEEKMLLFRSHQLDEESDVRACVVYSHKSEDLETPVKILNRLHIQYQDMESVSRLLLSPSVRQTLADAFHFLIILRYSLWLLCSLNLRFQVTSDASDAGDDDTKSVRLKRQALFCLRFRCLKAVTRLLEFVMFELHDGIIRLERQTESAADFPDLQDSLSSFVDFVRKTTLADRKKWGKTLTDIVIKTALKMQQTSTADDAIVEQVQRVEKIVHLICD